MKNLIDLDVAKREKLLPDLPVLPINELMAIDLPDRPRYLPCSKRLRRAKAAP